MVKITTWIPSTREEEKRFTLKGQDIELTRNCSGNYTVKAGAFTYILCAMKARLKLVELNQCSQYYVQ